MQNISNIIEEFILSTMGEDNTINLSRNDMAEYFNCAPSQINYVLTTRFNINRGYVIQSQRGGGGFIRIYRIEDFDENYVHKIIDEKLNEPISYRDAMYIIEDLERKKFIKPEQVSIISYALSPKALTTPVKMEEQLRVNILKNILINIIKEG